MPDLARTLPDTFSLSSQEYGDLLVGLFDRYHANLSRLRIPTFDLMAQGIAAQNGVVCTFNNCLGSTLTIGPNGEIFSCNRFAHHREWQLGSVLSRPSLSVLASSIAWRRLHERETGVAGDCAGCLHFKYCRGGCPYNAIT